MIKCKNAPDECKMDGMCCKFCDIKDSCEDVCDYMDNDLCLDAYEEAETTDMTLFQNKAMVVMRKIAELDIQKKQLEAQDKAVRQELQEAMDKYGIKKFENDILKVTYVEPTTRTSIDSARLKKELPAIAEKYTKTSQVKGSVRIEVK